MSLIDPYQQFAIHSPQLPVDVPMLYQLLNVKFV